MKVYGLRELVPLLQHLRLCNPLRVHDRLIEASDTIADSRVEFYGGGRSLLETLVPRSCTVPLLIAPARRRLTCKSLVLRRKADHIQCCQGFHAFLQLVQVSRFEVPEAVLSLPQVHGAWHTQ
eukprot:4487069-Amphidinium_carterae.1